MTTIRSSVVVGSYRALPDQTMTFGGGAEIVGGSSIYGDSIYLTHPTAALSLISQVNTAIANQEAGGACVLQENGKIKLSATGAFSVDWTGGALLRDLLGFTGNLSLSSSYEATNISPILWIPFTTENPTMAVLGLQGLKHEDVVGNQAPDGTQRTHRFGSPIQRNRFGWVYIGKEYYQTTDDNGGELSRFWDDVLVIGSKFTIYREINVDTTSTSTISLPGTPMGPFEMEAGARALPFRRAQAFERVERQYDFSMPVLVTPEYSA